MGPVSASIEVDASRERIFRFIADLANRPSFTDHFITDLRLLRIRSSGVGAAARFRFTTPPQAVWMETRITEVEAPYRLRETGCGGRSGRLPSNTAWELVEGPGTLTTVKVAYWTTPTHPVDRVRETLGASALWYERDWKTALRRLRDLLEADRPTAVPVGVAGGNRHATGVP